MIEVNKGVLVIGLSNTILFGGEQTTELLMLDVATGNDFSLPLSEEQVEFLLSQVTLGGLLDLEESGGEDEESEPEEQAPVVDSVLKEEVAPTILGDRDRGNKPGVAAARARLDGILNERGPGDVSEGVDAWTSADKTPQL